MKKIIMTLLFSGFVTSSYCQYQHKKSSGPDAGSFETEELPKVITKNTGKDFLAYIPDKNPDNKVIGLQKKFFDYHLEKGHERAKPYLVTMKMKNGSLAATYNEEGKLTTVIENYENVKLPNIVVYTILKKFPKWEIINDTFLYTQEDGNVMKNQYSIKIKKDHEVRKLTVHANGELLEEID
ncbi:hypothetical protein ACM55K_03565 [Flavobacterium sp. LT1R49]|uniref:hypothetical protein n=1 Tax=Flavobacterium arabinosi TaxID=3398737 RepID=UPI003A8AD65D